MKSLFFTTLLIISLPSHAAWTEFREVGQLQSYGGSVQVWLKGFSCPNSKPYFTISESYTSNVDRIISMILMAKASKTKINFQFNTSDNPSFCYVTGIQVE